MLNKTQRTRFKVTLAVIVYMMVIGMWSLAVKMTEVTVIALGVISASGIMYSHVETKRKSTKDENLEN